MDYNLDYFKFNKIKIPNDLIKNLDNIFIDFNNSKIENLKIIDENINNSIETNHFLTDKIKQNIKKLKKFKQITFDIKNTKVLNTKVLNTKVLNTKVLLNLYFNKISKKKINDLIKIINFSITTFSKLNNYRNNVRLDIYYCNLRKFIKINKKNQLVPNNINSGFTTFFAEKDDDYCVIYRQEELHKVIIHELIHLYRFHNFKIKNPLINEFIKTKMQLDISEAYTETFATILYTYYYSKLNNQDFNKLMNEQFNFSLLQSAKILYNQNINKLEYPINIDETTNTVSYFILKSAIFNNFKLFGEMFNFNLINLDKNNIYLNEKNKVLTFNENLIKSIKNKNFVKYINNYLILLKNNKINRNLLNTFRMNILD